MSDDHRLRVLAAPTLDEQGGGVAAVARLAWRSCQETWNGRTRLLSLPLAGTSGLTTATKLSFGARVAAAQATGRARWLLFAHLGPARAQRFVPAALQRPYGVILYGVEAWAPLEAADRQILANARLRLAISSHSTARIQRAHPDIGPVVACPLCLPPDDDAPMPARVSAAGNANAPIVLMVGRLNAAEAYKGHDDVIAAWPAVIAAHPAARLVIVGDGDDGPRLRQLAAAHGVAWSIDFTGFVARRTLQQWYQRAAVFALPSRGEGFGLVYLEAMAHALPCVASTDDAASDIVRDGETGCLVPFGARDLIANRLVRLLADAELRTRLGAAGAERVRREFSWPAFQSRFISLLETHLEGAV